ncbi:alpha/beta hydrolase [Companilactobacillus sp. DQM5]|uniref:alpha/beta hydrolase n=1 Tax=Companilactobacillus sp. DQM5 TaxID=3463359 RepID=UPI004059847E
MIYLLLAILLVLLNLFVVVKKVFDIIHSRGSNALGGEKIVISKNHPLFKRTLEFSEQNHEIWEINNDNLNLKAFYYPQKESKKTVILTHGFGATHKSLDIFGQLFFKLGYNVLMPDNRAAGDSEGRYLTFGFYEKKDLLCWINELNNKHKDQNILLFGASMGAATVLQLLAEDDLPLNVKAVVEDSSYTDAESIIKFHAIKKIGRTANLLIPLVSLYSKIRLGFFYKEASPINVIKNDKLPILFVIGDKDVTVPSIMGKKLYDSYQGEKDLYENPEGIHIRSYNQNPKEYEEKLINFLNKNFEV